MTIEVDPQETLIIGSHATVSVQGPPNTTVTVHVTDGGTPEQTDDISIDLDASGEGSSLWEVPNWDGAVFSYGDCEDETRSIEEP